MIEINEIKLEEIRDICDSPNGVRIKRLVKEYIRSKPGFNPERKRLRSVEEAEILNKFIRK